MDQPELYSPEVAIWTEDRLPWIGERSIFPGVSPRARSALTMVKRAVARTQCIDVGRHYEWLGDFRSDSILSHARSLRRMA